MMGMTKTNINTRILGLFLLAGAIFLFPARAFAAPSISGVSGTVSDGSSITISGSGFGTKSSASPLVFDTFESGTNGAQILESAATVGDWDTGSGYESWYYTTTLAKAGSKSALWAASVGTGNYAGSLSKNGVFPTVYMDWWMRIDHSGKSRNYKPWRLYGASDTMEANSVIFCDALGSGMSSYDAGVNNFFWSEGGDYQDNVWEHWQVWLQHGSIGGANGTIRQYINRVPTSDHTDVVTRTTSNVWDQIRVGHYWSFFDEGSGCGDNPGANIYIDNIYIDTAFSRVELCNNATYSSATSCEIIQPTAWSSGSITATVRSAALTNGTAYLFVFDGSNVNNSTGYAVTIGGGGDTTSPVAPTGLAVQ